MNNVTVYDMLGNQVTYYFQWDINQYIVVGGVPTSPMPVFQFSNKNLCETISVVPSLSADGNLIAKVPNELLEMHDDIHLYIYRSASTGASRTLCEIRIKVIPRKKPEAFDSFDSNEIEVNL